MDRFDLLHKLAVENDNKLILLIMDGLGDFPMETGGLTALEAADTPNLDRMATEGSTGFNIPVRRGIAPGSGPAHLGLFGYDPLQFDVGRGVLSALGIDFDLQPRDLAARGNFATVDKDGIITDRRAGRIPTELGAKLARKLQEGTSLPGYEIFVLPEKEYRFVFILRGEGLSEALSETDPLQTGKLPLPVLPLDDSSEAKHSAELVNDWVKQARALLKDERPANSVNLRGFAMDPALRQFPEIYKLRAAAIAQYPMYRGVSKLVGMDVQPSGKSIADEFSVLESIWEQYDFFFLHVKPTDSRGEDGNFEAKVKIIEEVDAQLPRLLALQPSVVVITGDHSTPAAMRSHSWHPVPLLFWGQFAMPDDVKSFGERAVSHGYLGHLHSTDIMPLLMAHAGRLERFGA